MTTESQRAADRARIERDKEAGIGQALLRIKTDHKPWFYGMAAKSRAGTLDTQEDDNGRDS